MNDFQVFTNAAVLVQPRDEQWGFSFLTGERCGYMRRGLFDMNEHGAVALRLYFGLPHDTKFNAPWNTKVNGLPSVGSVLLEHAVYRNAILPFAAMQRCGVAFTATIGSREDELTYACSEHAYRMALAGGVLSHDVVPDDKVWDVLRVKTMWMPRPELGPQQGGVCTHQMTDR